MSRLKRWCCETCTNEVYTSEQPPPSRNWRASHVCNFIPVPDMTTKPRLIRIHRPNTSSFDWTMREFIHANYSLEFNRKWEEGEEFTMQENHAQAMFMLRVGETMMLWDWTIERIE